MTAIQYTADQLRAYIADKYEDQAGNVISTVNKWLRRGDGAAVYENHDLGHPEVGAPKITSYGSPAAQLETTDAPKRLPDIGGQINWRYVLVGTYRGPELP